MNTIPSIDLEYLAGQPSEKMDMILSGMASLMSDTDCKVDSLNSQGWFQRMWRTVTGNNRATRDEIRQNHDKLNAYMAEAVSGLYDRQLIDERIMLNLGVRLTDLCAQQAQLKMMLGAFVTKLNEKIESVDNFHLLETEIEQGRYSHENPVAAMCRVLSQLDDRVIGDSRKIDVLTHSLEHCGVLCDAEITLAQLLDGVAQIPVEHAGSVALAMQTFGENVFAVLIAAVLDSYQFLPDLTRKMKKRGNVVAAVIAEQQLDGEATMSTRVVFDELLRAKADILEQLRPYRRQMIEEKARQAEQERAKAAEQDSLAARLKEAEQLFLRWQMDDAFMIFRDLADAGCARAMYHISEYFNCGYGEVVQDKEKCAYWRKRGAELGDPLARLNSAFAYPKGSLERKSILEESLPGVKKLATEGDAFAQLELAALYRDGQCVEKDIWEAIRWYKKSLEQGYWKSARWLASFYANGVEGQLQADREKYLSYLKMAANLGDEESGRQYVSATATVSYVGFKCV
ncbi:MAG: sel1 repeat family protein [Pyramidobacter sp.]|nr:sel1 repeat family protein [Pyramidobacter sp.]